MTENNRGYFHKSQSDHHDTPKWLFDLLNYAFEFDFDPCPPNADFDGLKADWGKSNFVNPPYSQYSKWIEKGVEEWKKGKTIVFLLNSLIQSTNVYHELLNNNGAKTIPIQNRLKFGNQKSSAPFASIIVILKREASRHERED